MLCSLQGRAPDSHEMRLCRIWNRPPAGLIRAGWYKRSFYGSCDENAHDFHGGPDNLSGQIRMFESRGINPHFPGSQRWTSLFGSRLFPVFCRESGIESPYKSLLRRLLIWVLATPEAPLMCRNTPVNYPVIGKCEQRMVCRRLRPLPFSILLSSSRTRSGFPLVFRGRLPMVPDQRCRKHQVAEFSVQTALLMLG